MRVSSKDRSPARIQGWHTALLRPALGIVDHLRRFAFPFTTIEDILFFDRKHIGVLNDNNFPFSVGRHVGSGQPDDNEFIIIKLDRPL
jgi:glycerophosphoryl diester phosphodiesterase